MPQGESSSLGVGKFFTSSKYFIFLWIAHVASE
jgi:hypothetical protein